VTAKGLVESADKIVKSVFCSPFRCTQDPGVTGGGKVIDTARTVSNACNLPVVSCPTVAASDAPTSALSVIHTPEGNFKTDVFYKHNPSLVLVDTRVIASAPVRFLSAGIGDGLATMYEADTVFKSGKLNFRGGHTTVTARVVAKTSHDALTEHGAQACDAVSSNALDDHVEKVASGLISQLFMERQDSVLLEEVVRFCSSVNLPTTLADNGLDGVSDADLQKVAVRATQPGETIHNELFEVTPPMVGDAIRQADTLGRSLAAS
jgi:glycerol dehydrogenase